MSQGPDASKDAESAGKAAPSPSEDSQSDESLLPRGSSDADGNGSENASSNAGGSVSESAANADAGSREDGAKFKQSSPTEEPANAKASRGRDSESTSKASRDSDDEEVVIPETEEALNIPKNQTIGMLGAMSTLTIIAWFASRLACNAHPDQVREPKHFSTKDLAADPKNAAFEFHHSFETGDYTTALDLASGEIKSLVTGKLEECEKTPDVCDSNQKALEGSVNSVGKLLEQTDARATVELVSVYRKVLQPKTFQFVVEKQGEFWRVTSRKEVPNNVPVLADSPHVAPATVPQVNSAAPVEQAASVPTSTP